MSKYLYHNEEELFTLTFLLLIMNYEKKV